ncbi:MAG: hypothetical protein MJ094_08245 [Saccharofermentans sp.]|nr:hypothetical protein [Saccharofermentans sp.]
MKKLTSILLICSLGLSVVACNSNSESSGSHDRSETGKPDTIETTEEVIETTETQATMPAVNTDPCEYIGFHKVFNNDSIDGIDPYTSVSANVECLVINDATFPALHDFVYEESAYYIEESYRFLGNAPAEPVTESSIIHVYSRVYRADSTVFSYVIDTHNYNADSNIQDDTIYHNLDPVTAQEIPLDAVLNPNNANARSELATIVISALQADINNNYSNDWQNTIQNYVMGENVNFIIENDGLTVVVDRTSIGSYSNRNYKIAYAASPDTFNAAYFASVPENYCYYADSFDRIYDDINNDGTTDCLTFTQNSVDEYYCTGLDFYLNGTLLANLELEALDYDVSLVHCNNQDYIYIVTTFESDYNVLNIYSLSEAGLNLIDTTNLIPTLMINPASVETRSRSNCLSTLTGFSDAYVDANGTLVNDGQYYLHTTIALTSTVELTGDYFDGLDNWGAPVTYPAGTRFHFYRTDNETYLDMYVINDGLYEFVRFDVSLDWENGGQTIEGMTASDCFEYLFYAG